jgi:putative flippase GtrA
MNMLLEASNLGIKLCEIEINTVYINDNKGTHFNTFKDSWRIYRLIILFGGSSLISFLIDYALYALFVTVIPAQQSAWLTNVVMATIAARVLSSAVNFMINRHVIFAKGSKKDLARHLIGYYVLAACVLAVNTVLVSWFCSLGVNEYLAKLPVEVILFFVSFFFQKRVVFR